MGGPCLCSPDAPSPTTCSTPFGLVRQAQHDQDTLVNVWDHSVFDSLEAEGNRRSNKVMIMERLKTFQLLMCGRARDTYRQACREAEGDPALPDIADAAAGIVAPAAMELARRACSDPMSRLLHC